MEPSSGHPVMQLSAALRELSRHHGVVKYRANTKKDATNGRFATKYEDSRNLWYHDLNEEDYGRDKTWVLLKSAT